MSQPWFFEDVRFDHAAADAAATACDHAAAALDSAAFDRWQATAAGLARCAGPYADDLMASLHRTYGREVDLAAACRRLAASLRDAVAAAGAENTRREELRDVYEAELARDRARAAAAASSPTAGAAHVATVAA